MGEERGSGRVWWTGAWRSSSPSSNEGPALTRGALWLVTLQVGCLWAAMVSAEMQHGTAATAAAADMPDAQAGTSTSSGSGSHAEAAAASAAYGMMSSFACELGALLAGCDAAQHARAGMEAYLGTNRMWACRDLLRAGRSATPGAAASVPAVQGGRPGVTALTAWLPGALACGTGRARGRVGAASVPARLARVHDMAAAVPARLGRVRDRAARQPAGT